MFRLAALFCFLCFAAPAIAQDENTIVLEILPLDSFRPGHDQHAIAHLTHRSDGSPVLPSELAVAHTKRFHLLIVDESLEDFQHVHPDMEEYDHSRCPRWHSCNPGEYPFVWRPKLRGLAYRAWADITPQETAKQEFAMAEIPATVSQHKPAIQDYGMEAAIPPYRFTLTADGPLIAGASAILHLHAADKKGRPLCADNHDDCAVFEPVLGAYAHAVGFNEDFTTVLHAHPLGDEPVDDAPLAASDLYFHIQPQKSGIYALFIQLRIADKPLSVPFTIMVGSKKPVKKTAIN